MADDGSKDLSCSVFIGIVLGTTTNSIPTRFANQRKIFFDGTYYFVFWYDGAAARYVYQSSNDLKNWSSKTETPDTTWHWTPYTRTGGIDVAYREGKCYIFGYRYYQGFWTELYWKGVISGTSIAFGPIWIGFDPHGSAGAYSSVAVTKGGDVWCFYEVSQALSWERWISEDDGSTFQDAGSGSIPGEIWNSSHGGSASVGLSNGKVLSLMKKGRSPRLLHYCLWDGDSWEVPPTSIGVTLPTGYNAPSAVAVDDIVYIAYLKSNYEIGFKIYDESWGDEVSIQTGLGITSVPFIALNRPLNEVFVIWAYSDHIYYRKRSKSGIWEDIVDYKEVADVLEESSISGAPDSGNVSDGKIPFMYRTGSASPFNVILDTIPCTPVFSGSNNLSCSLHINPHGSADLPCTIHIPSRNLSCEAYIQRVYASIPCSTTIRGSGSRNLSCEFYSILKNTDQYVKVEPQLTNYQDQVVQVLPGIGHGDQDVSIEVYAEWANLSCSFTIPEYLLDQVISVDAYYTYTEILARITPRLQDYSDQKVSITPVPWLTKDLSSEVTIQRTWVNLSCSCVVPTRDYKDQKASVTALYTYEDQLIDITPLGEGWNDQNIQIEVFGGDDQIITLYTQLVLRKDQDISINVSGTLDIRFEDQKVRVRSVTTEYKQDPDTGEWVTWWGTADDLSCMVHIPNLDLPCSVVIHKPWVDLSSSVKIYKPWRNLSCSVAILHFSDLSCSAIIEKTWKNLSCNCIIPERFRNLSCEFSIPIVDSRNLSCSCIIRRVASKDLSCEFEIPIYDDWAERNIEFYAQKMAVEQTVQVTPRWVLEDQMIRTTPRFDGNYDDQGVMIDVDLISRDIGVRIGVLVHWYQWPPLSASAVIRQLLSADLSCDVYIPPRGSRILSCSCFIRQPDAYVDVRDEMGSFVSGESLT